MNGIKFFALLGVLLAVTGCNRSISSFSQNTRPQALVSSPTEPVTSGELQPADGSNPEIQSAGDANSNQQIASLTPPPEGGREITREGMAGSWNVPSDNSQCILILAFTKWDGGYRATTRRCNSEELKTIGAWDVKGSRVVLFNRSGDQVASLYSSSAVRYDGSTASGKPIAFSR
ncbi:MAG: AprI/Inh family metalloprotease inhibitor [Rhizobiaceae bacterium]